MKLNMYESAQNLDYTSSGLAQRQHNNDSSDTALTSFNPAYLDAEMAAGIQGGTLLPSISAKFAAEHYLFIRAVLQLLGERDRVGVEANMDDPHTIKVRWIHLNGFDRIVGRYVCGSLGMGLLFGFGF